MGVKVPKAGGRLGDIRAVTACFWPASVGYNSFVNTNFTRLNVHIRKSGDEGDTPKKKKKVQLSCVTVTL